MKIIIFLVFFSFIRFKNEREFNSVIGLRETGRTLVHFSPFLAKKTTDN